MRERRADRTSWILAFDGSCGRCRRISQAVEEASRGRLEVRPLADPAVREWRHRALGPNAAWAPTVVRVDGDRVRAWTGPALGLRLVQRLGPRHTIRVLQALGALQTEARPQTEASAEPGAATRAGATAARTEEGRRIPERGGVRRRGLLKLGAGVGIGLGLMVSGAAPAFATPDPQKLSAARAWARANQVTRAGQYDELLRFDLVYRKTIFADLSPSVRQALWREQFARFRAAHTGLTSGQLRVLDRADALLAEPTLFVEPSAELRQRVADLEQDAIEVFGREAACGLFSTLGRRDASVRDAHPLADCSCSVGSACDGSGCTDLCGGRTSSGCGCFYVWACDGCYCA